MTERLESHSVSYYASNCCLLCEVSSRFQAGQFSVLAGKNGAGKTTLLRLLSGHWQPRTGTILIDGCDLRTMSLLELAQKRAVLPQHDELNAIFTVREIVDFALLPYAGLLTAAKIKEQRDTVLAELDLHPLQSRIYTSLSSGERQRVRLARVIFQAKLSCDEPAWLILDEPLTSLDWGYQHKLLSYLCRLSSQGLGVLAVLHDLNLVLQYADYVCLLRDGQLAVAGPSEEVLDGGNIRDVFGIEAELLQLSQRQAPVFVMYK